MQMTEAEIIKDYREAKDKSKQIGILADLNSVQTSEIKRIIGIQRESRMTWTAEMDADLRRWFGAGLTATAVAERMELDKAQVKNRLNRLGIKRGKAAEKIVELARYETADEPIRQVLPTQAADLAGELEMVADVLLAVDMDALRWKDSARYLFERVSELAGKISDECRGDA